MRNRAGNLRGTCGEPCEEFAGNRAGNECGTVREMKGGGRLLFLLSAAHLLVDGLCAATVFGRLNGAENLSALILLYNTLAFSTQCAAGLAADRLRRHVQAGSVSMLAVVSGWLLPLPPLARIVLIGLGNSVFHVAGGCVTLEQSGGRAGKLGVFVAPGAVGLTLGTLFPRLGVLFAALLVLCAVLLPVRFAGSIAEVRLSGPQAREQVFRGHVSERKGHTLVSVLLAAAVAVRAVGGSAVSFPWKTGAGLSLLLTLCVFGGKAAGGFVCDRIGVRRAALASILPASLLTAFCSGWMVPSLAGQFALNLTMPVTLWLMYRAMPDAPGFAFGLAASALWPGTLAGRMIEPTGPARWILVLACFLGGLWAILYAEKQIDPEAESRGDDAKAKAPVSG